MRESHLKKITGSLLVLAAFAVLPAGYTSAQDWSIPHSWRWPLYTRVESGDEILTGEPRPAVWTSDAEFQKYSGKTYLHPGVDIRGDHGDPVIMPTDGTIERVFHWHNHCLLSGSYCRAWFKTDDDRYFYYVSHIDLAPTPAADRRQVTTELREKMQNVLSGTGDRSFAAGQKLATLTMFSQDVDGWHHLHIGAFDRLSDYELISILDLFEQQPQGETGISMLTLDDEAPIIAAIDLVTDQTRDNAVQTGVCGDEIWGPIDIVAEVSDTFFTSGIFEPFPGLGTQPPTTGIRMLRYLIVSLATSMVIEDGTWFDLAHTPMTCPGPDPQGRACLPQGQTVDDDLFLESIGRETGVHSGAPSAGLSVLDKLFDVTGSSSNYSWSELYRHIVTNTNGTEGAWHTQTLPNGRYQVSVEATDFSGNSQALTRFVTVRDPTTTLDLTAAGFSDVFVRDRPDDNGAIPSNLGGQPFWHSPDIILVPAGTEVTVDSPSTQAVVAANQEVWAYLRLNNNGCADITNVKAQLFTADPSAIDLSWYRITPETDFVGDTDNPDGVTVTPGGRAILGPYPWTPTEEDASFGGHRCLLASVSAPNDVLPDGAEFDAPNHNNVGQRNLQVGNCMYQFPNPTTNAAILELTLDTDALVDAGEIVDLFFDYDPAWFESWSDTPGVSVSQYGVQLRVRMLAAHVLLPEVILPGGSIQNLSFGITLPAGTQIRTVSVAPRLNGDVVEGVSCSDVGGPIVY